MITNIDVGVGDSAVMGLALEAHGFHNLNRSARWFEELQYATYDNFIRGL